MFKKTALVTLAFMSLGTFAVAQKPSPFGSKFQEPDNTKKNKMGGTTADQQGTGKADVDMTKQIRKAITDDKAMSTYAKNVKVVTKDGKVTLRGPVNSADEKDAVSAKAVQIAGADNVSNQLEVKMKQ